MRFCMISKPAFSKVSGNISLKFPVALDMYRQACHAVAAQQDFCQSNPDNRMPLAPCTSWARLQPQRLHGMATNFGGQGAVHTRAHQLLFKLISKEVLTSFEIALTSNMLQL